MNISIPPNQDELRKQKLIEFLSWFKKHIKGRERSEAQVFLERLFIALGNDGALDAGALFEDPVKKRSGKTGFVDLVWKPRVIIEMKGRGENLRQHYAQAAEYWFHLVPNRPQYMVLCNFDEFWIFDLNLQLNDPVHTIETDRIAEDYPALAFLYPIKEQPVFNNNNVVVTERAAEILGRLYLSLLNRDIDQERAQRFVLQIVVSLFSEDVGLLPKNALFKILELPLRDPDSAEEKFKRSITSLFEAMSQPDITKKPVKHKDIPFFNGCLFSSVSPVELKFSEIHLLVNAAKENWQNVRPSIFGSIFESSLDPQKRHDDGVHFTHEIDIYKIVMPSVIRPFRFRLDRAKSKKELRSILKDVASLKVLDPACGSGNFLYVAFRELRRLEFEILERVDKNFNSNQHSWLRLVSPKNFYGIDTNKFGLELAKVALSIGRKLSADEFNINEQILPFDDLDPNFSSKDALFSDWPEVDVIIGNPPFLGRAKTKTLNEGDPNYVKNLHTLYDKSFPKSADYCCYWFRKAHDSKAKNIGLVGSNSITQGNSRKASLDYIEANGGQIYNAISSQPWEGDAKVHVSIVNWSKEKEKRLYLDERRVDVINSSLKNEVDVTKAYKIKENLNICFQGVVPQPLERYLVAEEVATNWFNEDSNNQMVVHRLLSADDLTDKPDFKPNRFIIDFDRMSIEEASTFLNPFSFVREKYETMKEGNNEEHKKWWQLWRTRMKMKTAIIGLNEYIAIPGHSKWYIPVLVPKEFRAYVNSSFVVASDDQYLMGILTSKLHRVWVRAQSSTLEDRVRYTNTTCFETFPFLWKPDKENRKQIVEITDRLVRYRQSIMDERSCGITDLYNQFFSEPESQLWQLHRELDMAVCKLYGFKFAPDYNFNVLLFKLNKELFNLN